MTKQRKPAGIRFSVRITEEIIDHAVPRDSRHCMIADGVRAGYPQASRVSVDLATIRLTDPTTRLRYTFLTPRVVQVALVNFDRGVKPAPFDFQLRGAHVTRAGATAGRVLTEAQKKGKAPQPNRLQKAHDVLRKTGLRRSDSQLPDRIGGEPPPLQKDRDNIPFTRRRAFGLRALDM